MSEVPDWLLWRSRASPRALALKEGGEETSYGELQGTVSRLAGILASRGLRRGDRLALLMRPCSTYVALVHAVARLGAVAVPLNHLQSGPELVSQIKDSRPALVVHDAAAVPEGSGADIEDASALVERSAARGVEPVAGGRLRLSATHAIVYTSGSSGAPKGAELTLSNLMWNAVSVGLRVGASCEDRWLLCMPLFHVGGYSIIFRSLLYGSGLVIHESFDPARVSASLDDDRVTLVSFVPTMLTDVLAARGEAPAPSSLRAIFLGGGKPPAALVAAIRRKRLPVLLTYGMTETCSQVALCDASGDAYSPLLPSEVAVASGSTRRLAFAPPGEPGEIVVRGPTVFKGLWRRPGPTRARFRDGWLLTGDLGVLQPGAEGGVLVLGRKEEVIVSGGEKVFPAEVEAALREHPAVKDAAVVGVEDERWGQAVAAALEAKGVSGGRAPSDSELSSFLRERIARYKVPKRYLFLDVLPRTATGKVRRRDVRALFEEAARP